MSMIIQPLANLLQKFDDMNLHYYSTPYEELKAMSTFERIQLYNWTFEMGIACLLMFIYFIHWGGNRINVTRANRLFNSLQDFFSKDLQFSKVGFIENEKPKSYHSENQNTWFTTFATGRSTIESVTVKAHMYARSNPVSLIMESILGWFFSSLVVKDLDEFVEIVIKPNGIYVANENSTINNSSKDILKNYKFVTSVVNKTYMNTSRRDYYFLSCTHVTDNEILPVDYVFMSDVNQLNSFIPTYSKKSFITETLTNAVDLLQFVSFTDLPTGHPNSDKKFTADSISRAIIRTNIPKSKKDVETLQQVISAVIEIYDNCTRELTQNGSSALITPEILKKTNNFRSQELAKIVKEMKKIEMEDLKEKKLEAERELRRANKDSEAFAKQDQKMKEKRERRMRNKQKVRMG
ncbi:hypothetical protein TBLA_0F04030 [Henningerozyma blattae CBS 6284]|uniref:DUF1682-domain-containing protein n=1 Tax=Henningerozyma blattae (strain ATCC 34711 / CBS 6284 / DSM 70876 / NBRC 10599 / NRRL Y-10934 / UCD 77-7) TaxID=1071380 RepID=I2H6D4_HENB6|nr:hypothetical protein TBLA_0F04030 [Tetrapisispora blattae CBS 6284]CCH61936.1 hypothetical protein TBLA_0F04030 [Tetrapisispora blattae CBS 6284]